MREPESMSSKAGAGRMYFKSLQILRGWAALSVVLLHLPIGDYSYALYLTHVAALSLILLEARALLHRPVGDGVCVLALAGAIVVGWQFGKVDLFLHCYFGRRLFESKGS